MSDRNALAEILHETNELWRLGEPVRALNVLDQSIQAAVQSNALDSAMILARLAANVAESIDELPLARRYSEQALAFVPDNPMALYGLARILSLQGVPDLAKHFATKSYEVSLKGTRATDQGLLKLIALQWPEIDREHH